MIGRSRIVKRAVEDLRSDHAGGEENKTPSGATRQRRVATESEALLSASSLSQGAQRLAKKDAR